MADENGQAKRRVWDTYAESWGVADAAERLAMFERCLHPASVYTDPNTQTTGYAPLSDYMAGLHGQVPGVRFVTTAFDSHPDRSVAHWDMLDGEGKVLSKGVSFGVYGGDGRLIQETGFFAA